VIQITDSGLATSGDYRNYFEKDGSRYSHMIDPRSGYPIKHNLVSATVIAKSTTEADAFSTAMMVLGPQQAIKVAKENNISVYLIIKNGENFDAIFSKNLTNI
jgi:thiamine biosynthesis lipoprotein